MIEFFIDAVRRSNDSVVVAGRVYEGDVQLGLVFTRIEADESSEDDNARKVEGGAKLTVCRIVSYGHEIDELPPGMTGELTIQGTDAERVKRGTTLLG